MILEILVVGLLDGLEAAHSRSHQHANAVGIRLRHLQSGVAHGLHAGHHAVLHEGVHAARVLRAHIGLEVELADLAAEMRWKVAGVETRHRADAAAAGDDRGPRARDVVAHRRDDSKTRNGDASFTQPRLLTRICTVRLCPMGQGNATLPNGAQALPLCELM